MLAALNHPDVSVPGPGSPTSRIRPLNHHQCVPPGEDGKFLIRQAAFLIKALPAGVKVPNVSVSF